MFEEKKKAMTGISEITPEIREMLEETREKFEELAKACGMPDLATEIEENPEVDLKPVMEKIYDKLPKD